MVLNDEYIYSFSRTLPEIANRQFLTESQNLCNIFHKAGHKKVTAGDIRYFHLQISQCPFYKFHIQISDCFSHGIVQLRFSLLFTSFALVLHLFCTCFAQGYPRNSYKIFLIFAPYDTRTNQEYEGPPDRPKEVSLTSLTDNLK
jgi:hypothetical protein